jgi:hypothetical protein
MVQAALEKKKELPDWYGPPPPIHPEEFWYVQAFYDLSTCRNTGMSLGAIPWRDIVAYAQFHEIDDHLFPIFKAVITAMDATFLKFHDKASKDRAKEPARKPVDKTIGASDAGEVGPRRRSRKYQRGT